MSGSEPVSARIEALEHRLAGGPVVAEHPDDRGLAFMHWWLPAARLAMLGRDRTFRLWPEHASRLGLDVESALREAAAIGVETLGTGAGEPLAEAMIEADDASCLRIAERDHTGLLDARGFDRIIDGWLRAADDALLDEDARAIVIEHREAWPIPEEHRPLGIVRPLTELERLVGAGLHAPAAPERLAAPVVFELETAQFHDGRPPEAMRRRFAERRGEGVTPTGDLLQVSPRLDSYWGVFVEIAGAAADRVRGVRLGTFPLRPVGEPDDDVRVFEVLLAGQPLGTRMQLIASDIGVTTHDGGRFLL